MSFRMQYKDVPIMRSKYPFLEKASESEVVSLLVETCQVAPNDKEFADACRLELLFRGKEKEKNENHPKDNIQNS